MSWKDDVWGVKKGQKREPNQCPLCGGYNTHRVVGGGRRCISCQADFDMPEEMVDKYGEPSDLERW